MDCFLFEPQVGQHVLFGWEKKQKLWHLSHATGSRLPAQLALICLLKLWKMRGADRRSTMPFPFWPIIQARHSMTAFQ